jgi:tetratricopeptide (TPR) repeat protein
MNDTDAYTAYKLLLRANKRMHGNQRDYVGARQDLDTLLSLYPDEHAAYVYRAQLNFKEQRYTKSIADWTHVIRLNPTNGEGNYDRGIVYQTLGRYEQASSDFVRALELFDLFPESHQDFLRDDITSRLEQIKSQR